MALPSIGGLGSVGAAKPAVKESFGKVLENVGRPGGEIGRPTGEMAPKLVQPVRAQPVSAAKPPSVMATRAVEQVAQAQKRLNQVLALAESGKTFTPAELIALQAQVSQASQQIDLAGKVVDKAVSGVKQILQTQV